MAAGRRRRVFVDLSTLPPDGSSGGAGRFVLALLEKLAGRDGAHDYTALVKPSAVPLLASLTGPHLDVAMLGKDVAEPRRLRRELRRLPLALARRISDPKSLRSRGADVLFSPLFTALFHEPDLRHVAVAHDFQELFLPDCFDEMERRRRAAFRRDLSLADHVVAVSEATMRDGVGHAGLDAARITVLPPVAGAARRPLRTADQAQILTRLTLSPDGFAVYPANYWPHKNHDRLLRAVLRARQGAPDFTLVLCGALDARRERLLAIARDQGLDGAVRVLSYLPDADVTALLQGARFLVFPSLFEGFGIPVLEAMSLGTAVACSDIPALRELAAEDALFFNPEDEASIADALELLWRSDRTREALAEAGRVRAERVTAVDTVSAYHRLLSV
ncbi:MAG: glycosyltransferase family 4 protein [Thermoanaerobaculia bacterium]